MSVKFQDFKDKQSIRKLETKIGASASNISSTITIYKMVVLFMFFVNYKKKENVSCPFS